MSAIRAKPPWRRRRFDGPRAAAALFVALCVVSAFSQTPAATQPPPQPTFRTEANYVRVDVYPTKDGAPVTDLRQEDFEVIEAGAPQKIEQFERVLIQGNGPQAMRAEPNSVQAR